MDPLSPASGRRWLSARPEWLRVTVAKNATADPRLDELDPGERAAILLAAGQSEEVLLLIDDAAGRSAARQIGISTVGTLRLLREAAHQRLLDLPAALNRLSQTNFRVSERLLAELLREHAPD